MDSQNLETIWMEFMAEFKKTQPNVTGIPLEILGLQLEKALIKAHLAGAIVTGAGGSRNLVQGIWFSRETAELALKNQARNLPEKAYVYCYSGGNSNDYKSLYRAARSELGVF